MLGGKGNPLVSLRSTLRMMADMAEDAWVRVCSLLRRCMTGRWASWRIEETRDIAPGGREFHFVSMISRFILCSRGTRRWWAIPVCCWIPSSSGSGLLRRRFFRVCASSGTELRSSRGAAFFGRVCPFSIGVLEEVASLSAFEGRPRLFFGAPDSACSSSFVPLEGRWRPLLCEFVNGCTVVFVT